MRLSVTVHACACLCVCMCVRVLPVCVSFEAEFMQVMLGPRVWLSSCARVKLFASSNIYWHRCPAALRPRCVRVCVCVFVCAYPTVGVAIGKAKHGNHLAIVWDSWCSDFVSAFNANWQCRVINHTQGQLPPRCLHTQHIPCNIKYTLVCSIAASLCRMGKHFRARERSNLVFLEIGWRLK